mmetsp:Transcript_25268/g.30553  ORF Transcript_25268/g.30553 Transcript_25268/m.30553 type:complete len:291 (-) Transcript_25268:83-955(-)
MEFISSLSASLDRLTGYENTIVYLAVSIICIIGFSYFNAPPPPPPPSEEDEKSPPKPRNFTLSQLRKFDGTKDEKTNECKPLYLSLGGIVFDVSLGSDFYGPGGPYAIFAGRECGVALAKMSFDEKDLDDVTGALENLSYADRMELEGWVEKFTYYRPYDVVGRLVPTEEIPSRDRVISREEMAKNDGTSEDIPDGYAVAPIYVALSSKVFDVSFGGVEFYGVGGAYHRFAGKDASRALAKMSFDPKETEYPVQTQDLTEKEKKILNDWIVTFEEKKGYPIVGILEEEKK